MPAVTRSRAAGPVPAPVAPPPPQPPPYTIQITNNGQRMIATRLIACGSTIITETPLLWTKSDLGTADEKDDDSFLKPKLWDKYLKLAPADKSQYSGLHINPEHENVARRAVKATFPSTLSRGQKETREKALARLQTNCFKLRPTDKLNTNQYAVYKTISRVNHSCSPNEIHHVASGNRVMVLTAARDIQATEEITISYEGQAPAPPERQKYLRHALKFDCECDMCRNDFFAYLSIADDE